MRSFTIMSIHWVYPTNKKMQPRLQVNEAIKSLGSRERKKNKEKG